MRDAGQRDDRERHVARRAGRTAARRPLQRDASSRSRGCPRRCTTRSATSAIRVRIVEPGVFETGFRGNIARYGVDAAPYDELDRQWESAPTRS